MRKWFTADMHFGHENIIRYCGRPFASAAEMNAAIIDNWNRVVDARDDVYVLGDVALGRLSETLPLVRRLAGRKILIPGNHDPCWHGHRRGVEAACRKFLSCGFDQIIQDRTSLEMAGRTVLACHFPYRGDRHDERYAPHRPMDEGLWILHGHIHEKWAQKGRMVNVGVDCAGFTPLSEEYLESVIAAGPRDLDVHEPGLPG